MRELKRYFMTSLLSGVGVVLLILVALSILTDIADQVDDLGGRYGFSDMVIFVIGRIPGFLKDNFSFAVLIGCMVSLGMLSASSELTVVRTSGVSNLQLIWLVMRPVLLVIVFGLLVGEISAYTERISASNRALALHGKSASGYLSERQVWNREGNEFVRFDVVLPNGKVYGITRYGFDDSRQLKWIQESDEGTYDGLGWLLENVTTWYLEPTTTMSDQQETARWKTDLTPEMLTYVSTHPENLTFKELLDYSSYLDEQGLDNRSYLLEIWKKVAKPLELFSLVLIAISFVLGPLGRVTMGYRVFGGIVIALTFRILQDITSASSLVFGYSALGAVLFPIGVCMLIGVLLMRRAA